MAAMIKCDLLPLWHQKERELGRDLTVLEVAEAVGMNWETVANLKKGKTTRFDSAKIAAICEFFGVPEGEPVPFLKVFYGEDA